MANYEEWSLCAEWLLRVGVLPPESRITAPGAGVFEFAQMLRDGVVLCVLLNELSDGCVDPKDFSQRPQMTQFLCKKNILTFLKTCKNVFGLRDADLFETYDLFEVKDFEKVIKTLSKLSRTDRALRKDPHGFTVGGPVSHHDEDIYKNLEDLAQEMPDEDIYGQLPVAEEEDIYEDLCSMGKSRSSSAAPRESQRRTKWHFCVEELVGTERKYVEALNMIVKKFMYPLDNVMDMQSKDLIFGHMEPLYEAHAGLLRDLTSFEEKGSPSICDIFARVKPKLVVYGQYCANLTRAQEQVDYIMKENESARERAQACQDEANGGKFKLRDLLALPMQRVLKYQLLLRELSKHAEKDKKGDKKDIDKALEAMQDLSLYVNEVKRDTEALELIKEIKSNICDLAMPENTELQHYGRLLKDGELKVKSHNDVKATERLRYIFLFDKVMLMCKSKGELYTYKNALVLHQYDVDVGAVNGRKISEKWRHQFMLVEKANKTVHTFYAKTDDLRQKWIDAIRLAQDNFQPPCARENGHEFVMHTFPTPMVCSHCQKLLRGVFYQGYVCSRTGKNAHKECIGPLTQSFSSSSSSMGNMRTKKLKARIPYSGQPTPRHGPPLVFDEGDVIEILHMDREWYKGRFNNMEGWLPAHYVFDHRASSAQPSHNYVDSTPHQPEKSRRAEKSSYNGGSSGYVNLNDIEECTWFAGKMTREMATVALNNTKDSTFLVRERDQPGAAKDYALSIKFGTVKHIKIMKNLDKAAHGKQYFLADVRFFHSIQELVEFYQKNPLEESFPELKTNLRTPYRPDAGLGKVEGYAIATYDYSSYQTNQISLRKDDRVAILSRAGGQRGWWKGAVVNPGAATGQVGYFPLNYVEEES